MGKRKIKKQNKNHLNEKTIDNKVAGNSEGSMNTFWKIAVGVIAVLTMVFFVLDAFMNDDDEAVEEPAFTENLGYSKILAQDTFDKPENDYVVFFINGEEGEEEVNEYYSALQLGTATKKMYVVDMSEQVNSSYLVDDTEEREKYGDYAKIEYNKSPKNVGELEIYNFPTVINVIDGSASGYFEGDQFYDGLGVPNPDQQQQQGYAQ